MMIMAVPTVGFAANVTITVADSPYDLSTSGRVSGEAVIVAAGETVEVTGTAPAGVRLKLENNTHVILNNVRIDCSAAGTNGVTIGSGVNATITLQGNNSVIGGEEKAGVRINPNGAITIQGAGTLYAEGGKWGAGIGGRDGKANGTIIINGGDIEAVGGTKAAGIGGGRNGAGGSITISGGTVEATGGNRGAGIGGGREGGSGTIVIANGEVTAMGKQTAAGIGGGGDDSGGNTYGSTGSVTITGGTVYASSQFGDGEDIGDGASGSGTAVGYSGNAQVFLNHQAGGSAAPTTSLGYRDLNSAPAGYNIPGWWTYPIGAYGSLAVANPMTGSYNYMWVIALSALVLAALAAVLAKTLRLN